VKRKLLLALGAAAIAAAALAIHRLVTPVPS
jgi:hypothetical protein